ncbi:MAG: dipeptide epimerase [Defluviitaleaceae bacterium]|nr:dipeptide epimerase [Defluviitaleaceae bacterium]
MTIQSFDLDPARIPLKHPFTTAIRTVTAVESVQITLTSSDGVLGYGEAPATAAITGETIPSIKEAVEGYICPAIMGQAVEFDCGQIIQKAIYGNTSAKAAVEMAWQDLRAKKMNIPLYQLLGKHQKKLSNDITISAGDLDVMTKHAIAAIADGFSVLKLKVGVFPATDAQTIIRFWYNLKESAHPKSEIKLRIDANQGWSTRQAISIIRTWEDNNIPIDLIEQPTPAWDLDGLAKVQSHTHFPIAADESVFSPIEALRCIQSRAASVINIKLMKTGGISSALDICTLCRIYGVECMIGCMMEGQIGAAAAAHLATSQSIVTRIDIDSPLLCTPGFYTEGPTFCGSDILMSNCPGIGTMPKKLYSERSADVNASTQQAEKR